jgi:hypothetical protein
MNHKSSDNIPQEALSMMKKLDYSAGLARNGS